MSTRTDHAWHPDWVVALVLTTVVAVVTAILLGQNLVSDRFGPTPPATPPGQWTDSAEEGFQVRLDGIRAVDRLPGQAGGDPLEALPGSRLVRVSLSVRSLGGDSSAQCLIRLRTSQGEELGGDLMGADGPASRGCGHAESDPITPEGEFRSQLVFRVNARHVDGVQLWVQRIGDPSRRWILAGQ